MFEYYPDPRDEKPYDEMTSEDKLEQDTYWQRQEELYQRIRAYEKELLNEPLPF